MDDEAIRKLAIRMAKEHDVHVERAETAIRRLIRLGLLEATIDPDRDADQPVMPKPRRRGPNIGRDKGRTAV
jgi:hypothetical protein